MIIGSFSKNDLQLKSSYGSWPPCSTYMMTNRMDRHFQWRQLSATIYILLNGFHCLYELLYIYEWCPLSTKKKILKKKYSTMLLLYT